MIKITTSQNIHALYKQLLDYLKKVKPLSQRALPSNLLQAASEAALRIWKRSFENFTCVVPHKCLKGYTWYQGCI